MADAKIVELINQIGYFLRRKKQFDSALRVFQALQKFQPDYCYPHLGQALVYAERGDIDEAQLHFQLVLSRQPEHSFALACSGLVLLQRGEHEWRGFLQRASSSTDELGGKRMAKEILRMIESRAHPITSAPVVSTIGRLKRFS
ncbi:HrpB1 family type III secretion system apparatus protein [Burkholderia sp. 572]|uniref:tetratricopeptide repeat protein n=1 Tax=Burkholderia sp. 572 TaxID=3156414 RepID=UPI0033944525